MRVTGTRRAAASSGSGSGPEQGNASSPAPSARCRSYDRSRTAALTVLVVLFGLAVLLPASGVAAKPITLLLFVTQDLPVLPLFALATLARASVNAASHSSAVPKSPAAPWWLLLVAASAVLILCWSGRYIVFQGYDLSRDEQMAVFDAAIFSNARLFWPVAAEWQSTARALNQDFMLSLPGDSFWVSSYLPVHAAIRAFIGKFADPALTSPLFVVLGALSLWRIGTRLWPDESDSRLVALLLYLCSSQVLISGMTSFSMSAHLGLNLLWLALFLHGGRIGHLGAITTGFLATGLHQPLFHPLFVLPFLDMLRRQRRWRTLAFYLIAYGAIGLFWLAWPVWLVDRAAELAGAYAPSSAQVGFIARLRALLEPFDGESLWLMTVNLLRFVTWQHLLLVPLAIFGLFACRRTEPLVMPLAMGLLLPILVMAALLPWQGHGWGYRYLQPVLGNACILGAYGWQALRQRGLAVRRQVLWASAASVLLLFPLHAFMAYRVAAPYVRLDRLIAATPASVVIVDDGGAPYARDLVFNLPDLSNRPIRIAGSVTSPSAMEGICRGGSIAFLDAPQLHAISALYGLKPFAKPTPEHLELKSAAMAAGCDVVDLPIVG